MKLHTPLKAIRSKVLGALRQPGELLVIISSVVWYRLTTGHLGDIASRLLSVAELGHTNFSFELVYELVRSVRDLDLAAPQRAWYSRASCGRTIGRRRPA